MSSSALKLLAASGATDSATYVDDVFSTYLYDGNGTSQTITNGIDLSGEGGLVWGKSRNSSSIPMLTDTERGTNSQLATDRTTLAYTGTDRVTSFNSDGFALGSNANLNGSGRTQVAWTFRKAPGFFDIVTYTGNGATSRDINHNLETAPGMIIIKRTDAVSDWTVQHIYNNNLALYLNLTDAQSDSGASLSFNTSTFKVVGPSSGLAATKCTNVSGATYVAYLFGNNAQDFGTDSDEAIIKCGSYTGNGSTDGPTIDLGFEPQWVLIKSSLYNGKDWGIFDSMRGVTVSGDDAKLNPNTSEVESLTELLKFTPTGFKLTASNTNTNGSGYEYIYMAIRRPHKPAEEFAATDLYATAPQQAKVEGSLGGFRAGFVADFALKFEQTGAHGHDISCRLAAERGMYTNAQNAEAALSVAQYDFQDGMGDQSQASTNNLRMLLRRAPGYFDVVAYTGTGSVRTQAHNLGAVPEMIWVKDRSTNYYSWIVYHTGLNGGTTPERYAIILNSVGTKSANSGWWNNTAPTETVFTLGGDNDVNRSAYTYIAYLFATVSGISKVGHYTGTGNALNIDCGFSAGARFILIKGETSQGDWYVWDSYRGIVAGNDPYLLLNSISGSSYQHRLHRPTSQWFHNHIISTSGN